MRDLTTVNRKATITEEKLQRYKSMVSDLLSSMYHALKSLESLHSFRRTFQVFRQQHSPWMAAATTECTSIKLLLYTGWTLRGIFIPCCSPWSPLKRVPQLQTLLLSLVLLLNLGACETSAIFRLSGIFLSLITCILIVLLWRLFQR